MIVSPKKETAQVKVEDTQTVDTKAAETKIADNQTPQKQSPKKPSRQPKRWAVGLVAAGLLAVPTTIYVAKSRSQPKVDAIAAMGSRVRNDLVTVDRPLPARLFLLVRSALLDPKNDIF